MRQYNKQRNKMSNEPDVHQLQAELQDILEDAHRHVQKRSEFDDTRFSRWEGQSESGRKHEDFLGYKPTPWEGASDTRNRLADRIVNHHVHLSLEAFFRANMDVVGLERNDARKASYWRDCLKYFLKQKMLPELRREVEILAQELYAGSPAIAILGVYWQQESVMRMKKFSIEDIAVMVQSMGGDQKVLEDIIIIMQDPEATEDAMLIMKQSFPGVKDKVLEKGLKEFREFGETKLPAPTTHENRPRFVAHRLNEDIFLDSNTTEIDRARVIMRREWFTETELREKIVTEGFRESFVEEVLERAENTSGISQYDQRTPMRMSAPLEGRANEGDYDDLYEIFYAYSKQYDEDTNVPGIYCTAFSAHVNDDYGKHTLLEYGHNQMPFVLFSRERLSRSIFDSRGIPELVSTNQYESKLHRDLMNDASSISVLPPLLVNARRGGLNTMIAPASQMTITRPDDISWLQPPPISQGSLDAEKTAQLDAEKYFGMDPEDQERNMLYNQCVVNRWLDSWREALAQALCLCQQYLPTEFVSRITGGSPQEIQILSDDIQGQYDLMLRFRVDALNPQFMEKKLQAVTQLTQFDTLGGIDRNALLKISAETIDPVLADEIVMDKDSASQKEIEDEQNTWIKIINEIEPIPKEGVNFNLRIQTAQQLLQTSGELQKRIQESPLVKQLSDNRMQYLQFGIQQKQNAQIGRVGVKPVTQGGGY